MTSILFCCSYEQRFVILTSRNIPLHGGTVHLEHCLSCCVAVPLPAFYVRACPFTVGCGREQMSPASVCGPAAAISLGPQPGWVVA